MRRSDVHPPAIFGIRQPRFAPIRPTRGVARRFSPPAQGRGD